MWLFLFCSRISTLFCRNGFNDLGSNCCSTASVGSGVVVTIAALMLASVSASVTALVFDPGWKSIGVFCRKSLSAWWDALYFFSSEHRSSSLSFASWFRRIALRFAIPSRNFELIFKGCNYIQRGLWSLSFIKIRSCQSDCLLLIICDGTWNHFYW